MTATEHEQSSPSPEERAAQTSLPEFDSAIARNAASFDQLAQTLFYRQERFNGDLVNRLVNDRYYLPILRAFEAAHGAITNSYYCSSTLAAAVLTERDEICMVVTQRPDNLNIVALLFQCDNLHIEAARLLEGRDRRLCMEMIYSVVSYLLGILDTSPKRSKRAAGNSDDGMLPLLRDELARARSYYERSAERKAQSHYFLGMLRGVTIIAAFAAAAATIGAALAFFNLGRFEFGPFLFSFVAGGLGAVVSVMSRMSSGRLVLNYQAGTDLLRLLGGFRPIIGSIFGAALYFFLAGNLLPIAGPADPAKQLYFYTGIAFLAGFNERWAQDMLVVTGRRARPAQDHDQRRGERSASARPEPNSPEAPRR